MGILKFIRQVTAVITLLTMGVLLPEIGRSNIACDVYMYKNDDTSSPATQFSPRDRIIVRVKFLHLSKGSYTFQADWYNAFGKLQDTSSSYFTIEKTTDVYSESQLEIIRASALRRLFSTSETTGYNITFYGLWKVKIFLNGNKIAIKEFEVH